MRAQTHFEIYQNRFVGPLPSNAIQALRAVTFFTLFENSFTGPLPEAGIRALMAVTSFEISRNSFKGTLAGDALQALRAVAFFYVDVNGFSGMLPVNGIQAMSAVDRFVADINSFTGRLPDKGIQALRAVTTLQISRNGFTGPLPHIGIQALRALVVFEIETNHFSGTFPNHGIREVTSALTVFWIHENHLTGVLPDNGIQALRAVQAFWIHTNRFTGALPDNGLQALTAVLMFLIQINSFTGSLPDHSIQALRAVGSFRIDTNHFTGALPPAIQVMTLASFAAGTNHLAGILPDAFRGMPYLRLLDLGDNRLSGTLPAAVLSSWVDMHMAAFVTNQFEGTIPAPSGFQALFLSSNHLEGCIPHQLLGVSSPMGQLDRRIFTLIASELSLQGPIPESTSRLTVTEMNLVLGLGLKGFLPRIPGTLSVLSLRENGLEGHMPGLHFTTRSKILVHGNALSCKLPRNKEVKPQVSLALIGNHFAQPQWSPPAWITKEEQPSDMFCVSNKAGRDFLRLLICTACFFFAAAHCFWATTVVQHILPIARQQKPAPLANHRQLTRAQSAWYETSQQQDRLLVASFGMLAVCNMDSMACTVVSNRARFHFRAASTRWPVQWLVVCTSMMMCRSAVRFHVRHGAAKTRPAACSIGGAEQTSLPGIRALAGSMADTLWLLVCVLASTPSVVYATVHAVPGFLGMSVWWRWILSSIVSVSAGLVTGIGLPLLARVLRMISGRREALEVIGKLIASIFLPCLVTVLCHAKCLGAWTRFWRPCRTSAVTVMFTRQELTTGDEAASELLSRNLLCRLRWHMDGRECVEVVVERLSWLLYQQCTHYSFSLTAVRMLKVQLGQTGITLSDASVLLSYIWLLTTLFGLCLPILTALMAVLVKIYSVLLFGLNSKMLDTQGNSQEEKASVQSVGLLSILLMVFVLQSSNLPTL